MYARLVISAAANPLQCIRDIGRLITSANPSTSDLSGQGFSTSLSVVVDATPAGWTYVGSNKATDQPSIGAGSADATWTAAQATFFNWAFSAPCLNTTQRPKYAILTHTITQSITSASNYFALSGAYEVSALGVATSEGFRVGTTSNTSANFTNANLSTAGATTIHLIATPRHITIVQEGRGMMAVWETSSTPIHDRLLTAPFVQYTHAQASLVSTTNASAVISTLSSPNTTSSALNVAATLFAVTDINTGTYYGTLDASLGGGVNAQNLFNLFQFRNNQRANTIDSVGNPRYQVSPVFLQLPSLGYPTQYVTGVVPIYWCRAGLGVSGDTVNINGQSYYYFHTGAFGTSSYGVLLKTS